VHGILVFMSDVTSILSRIESGDPAAAEQLLPLVYEELRKLAAAKLAHEKPGQTLTSSIGLAFRRMANSKSQATTPGTFQASTLRGNRRIIPHRDAEAQRGVGE
jgi:ECF sigma factor